jgi:hypothetical protein
MHAGAYVPAAEAALHSSASWSPRAAAQVVSHAWRSHVCAHTQAGLLDLCPDLHSKVALHGKWQTVAWATGIPLRSQVLKCMCLWRLPSPVAQHLADNSHADTERMQDSEPATAERVVTYCNRYEVDQRVRGEFVSLGCRLYVADMHSMPVQAPGPPRAVLLRSQALRHADPSIRSAQACSPSVAGAPARHTGPASSGVEPADGVTVRDQVLSGCAQRSSWQSTASGYTRAQIAHLHPRQHGCRGLRQVRADTVAHAGPAAWCDADSAQARGSRWVSADGSEGGEDLQTVMWTRALAGLDRHNVEGCEDLLDTYFTQAPPWP